MNIFSLLSIFAFGAYLITGFIGYRIDPKRASNRIYFALCFTFAWYAFCYVFVYQAASEAEFRFWYKAALPGWVFFPGIVVHFLMQLAAVGKKRSSLPELAVFYLPGLLLLVKGWSGDLLSSAVIRVSFGYTEVMDLNSPWFWFFNLYYISYLVVSILLHFLKVFRGASRNFRIQTYLIIFSGMMALVVNSLTNILLPVFQIYVIPPIAPLFTAVWILGIGWAVSRFGYLPFSSGLAAEEILSRIVEMIVLVDHNGIIIRVNQPFRQYLGYSSGEMEGKPFLSLIDDPASVGRALSELERSGADGGIRIRTAITAKSGRKMPVMLSPSLVTDRFGDLSGVVIVAQDMDVDVKLHIEYARKLSDERSALAENENLHGELRRKNTELDRVLSELEKETEARRKMKERYQHFAFIANNSLNPMSLVARGNVYSAVNDAWCRSVGRERESALGRTIAEVWGENVWIQRIRDWVEKAFSGTEVHYRERFPVGPLGERDFEVDMYPYRDSVGTVTHVAIITRDQTAERH